MSAAEKWSSQARIAPTATVEPSATVGDGAAIWDLTQVRQGAVVGVNTVVGRNVYVDHDVVIGANCKIQNNSLLYWPSTLGDGVFIGPGAILTNDRHPRAINADGTAKGPGDWVPAGVTVDSGAAIGAGAVIVGGVHVGAWALVGAGAVVTRDVAPHSLVTGNPAVQVAWVGRSGRRLVETDDGFVDSVTGDRYRLVDDELVEER
jgi:acetyltransferase-like isoleucine patch superfamily enzyme